MTLRTTKFNGERYLATRAHRWIELGASLVLIFASLASQSSRAQNYGTLDLSWGGSGTGYVKTTIVSNTTSSSSDAAGAVAVQLDGRIIAAGHCYNGSTYQTCVARYNTDGTLDATFNGTGKLVYALGGGDPNSRATGLALLPFGKEIVVAQWCNEAGKRQFCAVRFAVDGSVNTGFGSGGKLVTTLPDTVNMPSAMAVQNDGKLLIGGLCGTKLCVLRYDEFGTTLDTAFGVNGVALNSVTGTFNRETYTMTLDASDRVLIAGSCSVSGQARFCVARFTPSGQIDSTFGTGGLATHDAAPGTQDYAYAIAAQNDGKILLSGQAFNTINASTVFDFATVRYNENGTLDTGFGNSGVVVTRVADSYSEARSVAAQADGKIVVAGWCYDVSPSAYRNCVVAYNADGSLDTSFNGSGILKTGLVGNRDQAYAMAIGRDRKLYLAGSCRYVGGSSQYDFCVARIHGTPTGGLACVADFFNDPGIRATLDSVVHLRLTQGIYTGAPFSEFAIFGGMNVPFIGFDSIWIPLHRRLLRSTVDYDGDGAETAIDSLIHARVALGYTGNSATNGLSFSPNATRQTWADIRTYLITRCGLALP